MAKFLVTSGISFYLEELIKNSQEKLILLSPFLKLNERIKELLTDKSRINLDIRIVYGKDDLQPEEKKWLENLQGGIRLSFCENLHAKCYLNENEAIITSMNLYEFSQLHNNEMGIYVNKAHDSELYRAIHEESMRIVRISTEEIGVKSISKKSGNAKNKVCGFCTRCHTEIPFNPTMPYCKSCYSSWHKYKNPEFNEKYCHRCGTDNPSTMNKPICYSCYKSNKKEVSHGSQTTNRKRSLHTRH
ncbi:MAG: phospholipase D family protein [Spirochaetota bacterium]